MYKIYVIIVFILLSPTLVLAANGGADFEDIFIELQQGSTDITQTLSAEGIDTINTMLAVPLGGMTELYIQGKSLLNQENICERSRLKYLNVQQLLLLKEARRFYKKIGGGIIQDAYSILNDPIFMANFGLKKDGNTWISVMLPPMVDSDLIKLLIKLSQDETLRTKNQYRELLIDLMLYFEARKVDNKIPMMNEITDEKITELACNSGKNDLKPNTKFKTIVDTYLNIATNNTSDPINISGRSGNFYQLPLMFMAPTGIGDFTWQSCQCAYEEPSFSTSAYGKNWAGEFIDELSIALTKSSSTRKIWDILGGGWDQLKEYINTGNLSNSEQKENITNNKYIDRVRKAWDRKISTPISNLVGSTSDAYKDAGAIGVLMSKTEVNINARGNPCATYQIAYQSDSTIAGSINTKEERDAYQKFIKKKCDIKVKKENNLIHQLVYEEGFSKALNKFNEAMSSMKQNVCDTNNKGEEVHTTIKGTGVGECNNSQ